MTWFPLWLHAVEAMAVASLGSGMGALGVCDPGTAAGVAGMAGAGGGAVASAGGAAGALSVRGRAPAAPANG